VPAVEDVANSEDKALLMFLGNLWLRTVLNRPGESGVSPEIPRRFAVTWG
jgi:hypothetical protein